MAYDDHFAIALDTLGLRFNSAILAIGVAQFNPANGKIGRTFFKEIEVSSAVKSGRIDADMLTAWVNMKGGKLYRAFDKREEKVGLATALDEMAGFFRNAAGAPKVWGRSSLREIAILEHAYEHGCVGLREPWHHNNVFDLDTLRFTSKSKVPSNVIAKNEVAASQTALDQAKVNAAMISALMGNEVSAKDDDGEL